MHNVGLYLTDARKEDNGIVVFEYILSIKRERQCDYLIHYLKLYENKFLNYFRMSTHSFEELHGQYKDII